MISDQPSKIEDFLDDQDIILPEDELDIDYKNGYPDLASYTNFEEAFVKARTMNVENFWFNKNLYHTQLKEDTKLEVPLNPTENLDPNITDQDIQNNVIVD